MIASLSLLTCFCVPNINGSALLQTTAEQGVMEQATLEALAKRIAPDVEDLRGLEFEREVPVLLADRETLSKYARERMDAMQSPEERRGQERLLKMLGLCPVSMDLEATLIDFLDEQAGGFYDPTTKTFYLKRGIDPILAETIIAHELVHALDDQHHDLDAGLLGRKHDSDAVAAFHAVMEGGALAIQNAWTMDNLDMQQIMHVAKVGEEMSGDLTDTPEFIWRGMLHSYMQGSAFLMRVDSVMQTVNRTVDEDDLERAFSEPPLSTEQILHPEKYWDAETLDVPTKLDFEPTPDSGWSLIFDDKLGEVGMAILLDPERDDRGEASAMELSMLPFTSAAASGWDGDRIALFEKGDAAWVLLGSAWDTEADAQEFETSLEAQRSRVEAALGEIAPGADSERGFTIQREGHLVSAELWVGERPDEATSVARVEIGE